MSDKTALESWNDPYDVRDVSLAEDVIDELEKSLALSRRDYDVMFQLHNGLEAKLEAAENVIGLGDIFFKSILCSHFHGDDDSAYDPYEKALATYKDKP